METVRGTFNPLDAPVGQVEAHGNHVLIHQSLLP
jgi:hypothetical protein